MPLGRSGAENYRVVRLQRVLSRAYVWFGLAIAGMQNRPAIENMADKVEIQSNGVTMPRFVYLTISRVHGKLT